MKTFEETTAQKFIVVRSLGIEVEIVLVSRNKIGYVASQMFYAATLAQGKPRKMFVAEFNEPMKALTAEMEIPTISAWDGAHGLNTHPRSRVKDIIALAEAEQITLDSIFHSAKRRDFYMAFVSIEDDKVDVAKFLTIKAANEFCEQYRDRINHFILGTKSQNPTQSQELKEIFAYFNPTEVHEIPGSTMRAFSKNVLGCTE